jgi:hypothetical protein
MAGLEMTWLHSMIAQSALNLLENKAKPEAKIEGTQKINEPFISPIYSREHGHF